jgi:ubiquinone biosynthesis monooxygenase Coq7
MESRHPLDPFIAAADRALRAVFAPAHASRPVPGGPPAAGSSASADVARAAYTTAPQVVSTAAGHTTASPPQGASNAAAHTAASPAQGTSNAAAHTAASQGAASTPGHAEAPASQGTTTTAGIDLSDAERRESAALMRVNHSGEVAAQALYHGQALVSRSTATRNMLLKAAREEEDHLAWCETRLEELGSRPSLLNPLWYCGSFLIGALAAAAGDRTSLGFVVETERQVEGHLDEHLARLPSGDTRSRAILNVMRTDEIGHGAAAKSAGASELPAPVRVLMRHTARVMTTAAYWI